MSDGRIDGGGRRPHARYTRRSVLAGVGVAGLGVVASVDRLTAHGEVDEAAEPFAADALPPELGQTAIQVYVEASRHTVGGILLDYWRATGGAGVFGSPISEPFTAADGRYSQAFERAILQFRPDLLWTDEPVVRPMPLGRMVLSSRVGTLRPDGRRANGGGDRNLATWGPVSPDALTGHDGEWVFVEATGHTIAGAFLAWYRRHEGDFYLGDPLGEPTTEDGRRRQWFELGQLVETDGVVALSPLGGELLARLGIDTEPVERGGLPAYDESLFATAPNPAPIGDLAAAGPRRVEIHTGEQRLWAYQGETPVATSLVSTGLDPNPTELGLFHVRLKYPVQDMRGFAAATGEVLATGSDGAPPGAIPYEVADVPHVMYFNLQAEALHGAYWHNNFGAPMSHGCVNLPLDVAAWLYGWAPLGTSVWVHE